MRSTEQHLLPFVDLFCGAGGLSVGFEQAGFKAVYANDFDPLAGATYAYNHPECHVCGDDVAEVTADSIKKAANIDRVPLVIGGPNCQGVSLRGKRNPDDPKNRAFFHFRRLIGELKPDWFVMENVPGLLHRHNQSLLTAIFEAFHDLGYRCGGEVLLAADYGVPQLRYRFILIGNRWGEPITFPDATHACPIPISTDLHLFPADERPPWLTVRDALSDLPAIENGGGHAEMDYPPTDGLLPYQEWCRTGATVLMNHVCHRTPPRNIELIKHIPPGKNWKAIPEQLRPERFKHVALKDHTTTFGRLRWDMPSRTVTTYFNNISSGAFTHPEQHRGISVREGARLQAFPDTHRFLGTLARQYRQVGNAVPPLLARYVATHTHQLLTQHPVSMEHTHEAAVQFDPRVGALIYLRPVQGMRFNLDRYLVRS